MNLCRRWIVWLSRIHRSRGFGIQSPSDYAFVRYVVNEHWPYYVYSEWREGDWLTRKLGRLYFRLANWRQPEFMLKDYYQRYWQSGCKKIQFVDSLPHRVELARVDIESRENYELMLSLCDSHSVLVVEGLWRDWDFWHAAELDVRTGTTFNLYYCGVIFFDKERPKHNYQINF